MNDKTEAIPVNLPFERLPQCACDKGFGEPPTKLQMMECKIRGGPCRESAEQAEQTPDKILE